MNVPITLDFSGGFFVVFFAYLLDSSLQAQKTEKANFLNDNVDTYLNMISHDGAFADHVCTYKLCQDY